MRSVKVAMRKGPDGKPLSMGFGFVECSTEGVAKAVLRQLQVRNWSIHWHNVRHISFLHPNSSCLKENLLHLPRKLS